MDQETLSLASAAEALGVSRQRVHQLAGEDPSLVVKRDDGGRLRLSAERVHQLAVSRAAGRK